MHNAACKVDECVPIHGMVYGVALYAGDTVEEPSKAQQSAPSSSVFFIKPRNTFLANHGTVYLPSSLPNLEARAALAICFGCDVRAVSASEALDYVAGFTLAIDLAEPGDDFFRPPIRGKCRDGFLPIGPTIVAKDSIVDLEEVNVRLEIDGIQAGSFHLRDNLSTIAGLIEEMSAFMTLQAGDVLLAARTSQRVYGRIGSRISAVCDHLGHLQCTLRSEEEVAVQ